MIFILNKKAIHHSHVLMDCEYETEDYTVEKVMAYLKTQLKKDTTLDNEDLDTLIRHERRKHLMYFHHDDSTTTPAAGQKGGAGGGADAGKNNKTGAPAKKA